MSLSGLVRACIVRRQAAAFVRGIVYRTLRRGDAITLNEITRRLLARWPDDFDEVSAARLTAEVARDYTERTRLRRKK